MSSLKRSNISIAERLLVLIGLTVFLLGGVSAASADAFYNLSSSNTCGMSNQGDEGGTLSCSGSPSYLSNSWDFDGSSDTGTIPAPIDSNSEYTIAVKFNSDNVNPSGRQNAMLRGGQADDFFKFNSGEVRYRFWDGSTNYRLKASVNANQDYTAVARFDSGQLDFWVNGAHEDSYATGVTPATKSSTRGVAYDNAQGDDLYNGQIYWFKIFDESLSDSEAKSVSDCGETSCNSVPTINSVSTTPSTWTASSSVDVFANVSDTDGSLSSVTADVWESNVRIKEDVALSQNANGNWTVSNLFSLTQSGEYVLQLNATDNSGASKVENVSTKNARSASLSWSHSGSPDGFNVYSNVTGGMNVVTDTSSKSFDHISTALSTGDYVCYEVTAFNNYGESAATSEKCGTIS